MASNSSCAFSLSPYRHCHFDFDTTTSFFFSRKRSTSYRYSSRSPVLLCCLAKGRVPYKNAFISEAVRLLGPPARFESSKLKVDFMGQDVDKYSKVVPRIYILSHCDFTANLTLTISSIINVDQLQGWYSKDDVVAEWKEMQGHMCLVVHCFVSGPSYLLVDLAAEFRYHIFSKELPLVLQAVLYGDSALFREHPELTDAVIWVYFHSSSPKYNCIECWGPLKDASQKGKQIRGLLTGNDKDMMEEQKWPSPKSFFEALFTFLL